MRTSFFLLLACFSLVTWRVSADGAGDRVAVTDAYVRLPPPGVQQAAAFFTLDNADDRPHALVAVSTPIAKRAALHTHRHEQGIMKMVAVARVDIAPHAQVKFAPGGLHVMLFELQPGLAAGQTVVLTLTFDDGSSRLVNAPVRGLR